MLKPIKRSLAAKQKLIGFIAIGYTLAITVIFLLPPGDAPALFPHADKFIHSIIYVILFLLWGLYLIRGPHPMNYKKLVIIALASLGYGIIIEALQELYIEGRQGDALDVMANLLGSILGLFLFLKLQKRFLK